MFKGELGDFSCGYKRLVLGTLPPHGMFLKDAGAALEKVVVG